MPRICWVNKQGIVSTLKEFIACQLINKQARNYNAQYVGTILGEASILKIHGLVANSHMVSAKENGPSSFMMSGYK